MFLIFFLFSLARASAATPELVIYTYDSLVAKGGLGPAIFPWFEKMHGCKIKVLASGDAGQLVTRLQLDAERGKPTAQLVLGLDQQSFARARLWLEESGGFRPKGSERIRKDLPRAPSGFYPFDYGVFAFVADREALAAAGLKAPTRLSDLLGPEWKRNLILEDPRTSSPGLAFILYVEAVYGNHKAEAVWKRFRDQWLTLAPGWDGAYGLFLKKEAPLVWSYTSSQAYHEEHGDRAGRYQALLFEEGQTVQVEGAAFVKGALGGKDSVLRKLAEQFLEFMVSSEVQAQIPLKNWMLPVVASVPLPSSFLRLPQVTRLLTTPVDPVAVNRALVEWKSAVDAPR